MKIVDAGYEILDPLNGEEILRKIERVARICYKSEDIGVQKIVTDFGEISLVLDRYADTKTILTVDLGEVQIAELRGTFYEDLPKAGDYFKGHVLNESTIKLLNSHAGSKISITEASL